MEKVADKIVELRREARLALLRGELNRADVLRTAAERVERELVSELGRSTAMFDAR